ncbi:MAG: alpha/beta fold hydrolase [Pseudomonadota bacterium]
MLPFELTGTAGAPIVVFLHGAGFGGAMWRPVVAHLHQYQCVLMDLPGHGAAVKQPFVSFEETAAAVARTVDTRFGGSPVHVVGLSLGAYVGLQVILDTPRVVRRAVLSGFHVGRFPNALYNRVLATALSPLATAGWYRRLAAKSLNVEPDAIFGGGRPTPVSGRALRVVLREALAFAPDSAALSGIATPLLAVAGENELTVIKNSVATLNGTAPEVVGRIATGLGHAWSVEAPSLFAETVDAFIQGAPLPDGLARPLSHD